MSLSSVRPGPASAIASALARAVEYLLELQGDDGSWTDFWLPVGASDGWVTGFVGVSLCEVASCRSLSADVRALADQAAGRGADWLERQLGRRDGWGFNLQ